MIIILAVAGGFIIYFWIVGWFMGLFDEAKKQNKRIEFSSVIITFLAFALSAVALYYSLNASGSSDDLSKRVGNLEQKIRNITSPTPMR